MNFANKKGQVIEILEDKYIITDDTELDKVGMSCYVCDLSHKECNKFLGREFMYKHFQYLNKQRRIKPIPICEEDGFILKRVKNEP